MTDAARAHHRFWPRRAPLAVPAAQTTLWDNLRISAERYPGRAATVFFGRALDYDGLHARAQRLAAWLQHDAGVRRGDRVVLIAQNSPQYAVAFYAILRAEAVVVPVNPMCRAEELVHYVRDPRARVALVAADLLPELARAQSLLAVDERLQRVLVVSYRDEMPASVAHDEAPPPGWSAWLDADPPLPDGAVRWRDALERAGEPEPYAGTPDDLVALCYTSGTTGTPKGCMHSHRTIGHNVVTAPIWTNATMADVFLGVVPMFHITGMQFALHVPVYLGATAVLMPRWDRELAGRLISRHRVSSWTNIPTMIIDLLASPNLERFDLSSLRYIGGGGAAMPEAIARRLRESFGLEYAEGYGLTETAAPSHSNPPDRPKRQCLGIPWIGTEARVVDPETLVARAAGETGEIVIAGPQVFLGYWERPADTAQALVEIDGMRFLRTGDLGHVDDEGYFFITDRLKRMINAAGFKVWPAEVENLLYHHPDVQEACVIAVRDAYRGETVKAVIVPREGARATISAESIEAWAREHLAAYKVPRRYQFVDALPRSGSGKVLWRVLQEREDAGGA